MTGNGAPRASPPIVVISTLDTKGREVSYVRDRLRSLGARPVVIDAGILGEPVAIEPDIGRRQVARAAGRTIDEVRSAGSRGAAIEIMQVGIRVVCLDLYARGALAGVLCLGGAEGAHLGAAAMHALPLGIPKLILSPSASGRRRFESFVGASDVTVMHSVVDIAGLNPIARAVYDNAVGAMIGMVRTAGAPVTEMSEAAVGVTMLGQTTPGAVEASRRLSEAGYDPVIFHANGVGGPAMERAAESGALAGVLDYTLSELANTVKDGIHATGPDRLRVAGRLGLPQVVVPGCADFFNEDAPVPVQYGDRQFYHHNPTATLIRLNHSEMAELATMIAERLSEASGPVHVIAPTRGFSLCGVDGGALSDPEGDRILIDTLEARLRSGIEFERVDTDINDPCFASAVADRFVQLMRAGVHA